MKGLSGPLLQVSVVCVCVCFFFGGGGGAFRDVGTYLETPLGDDCKASKLIREQVPLSNNNLGQYHSSAFALTMAIEVKEASSQSFYQYYYSYYSYYYYYYYYY